MNRLKLEESANRMQFVHEMNDFYKRRVFDKHSRIASQVNSLNLLKSQMINFNKKSDELRISRMQRRSLSPIQVVNQGKSEKKEKDK